MKKYSLIAIFSIFSLILFSQNEIDIAKILQKSTEKINSYKTLKVQFEFSTTLPQSKTSQNEKGKLILKGEKYHISLPKSEVYCDGKNIYTHLVDAKEMNITKKEAAKLDKGSFFLSSPKDIFKIHNKNFKSKLIKETTIDKVTYYEVELFPNELKTNYSNIWLLLDKNSLHIIEMKLNMKEGIKYTLKLSDYEINKPTTDNDFTFDEKRFPNVQINDMRF